MDGRLLDDVKEASIGLNNPPALGSLSTLSLDEMGGTKNRANMFTQNSLSFNSSFFLLIVFILSVSWAFIGTKYLLASLLKE